MDFALSEEQQSIWQLFRDFSDQRIRPVAQELDEHPRFPEELFREVGQLGFFGMRYPEPEGGGMDLLSYLLAVEELARGSLAVAAACTMQSLMGSYFVHRHAEGSVRERLVASMLEGKLKGTICMTEPDSGSDLFSMRTTASEEDGRWFLDGQKTWITSAPVADVFTCFARTGEKELGIFLVEKGAKGLVIGKAIDKSGVRASLTSELSFDRCETTCLLGDRDAGIASLREVLAEIRLMTAALSLGIARAALDEALRYAKEREQFGRPIGKFQAVQMHLAEMGTELQAARSLTHWAAWRSEQGMENADQASMAKLFASETAMRICDKACRIHASYGFAKEYPVERYLRDVRFVLIGGGTSEILKSNIARGMQR